MNELGKTVYGRGKGKLALRQQRSFSSKYVHSWYNTNSKRHGVVFALIFVADTTNVFLLHHIHRRRRRRPCPCPFEYISSMKWLRLIQNCTTFCRKCVIIAVFSDAPSFMFYLRSVQPSCAGPTIRLTSGRHGSSTFSIKYVFCLQYFFLIKPLIFNLFTNVRKFTTTILLVHDNVLL